MFADLNAPLHLSLRSPSEDLILAGVAAETASPWFLDNANEFQYGSCANVRSVSRRLPLEPAREPRLLKQNRLSSSPPDMHRILIADDHPVIREGLAYVLGQEPDCECAQGRIRGRSPRTGGRTHPDLVITDLSFPERSGLELIKDLATLKPAFP